MGKIVGATTLHTYGMDMFGELLPKTAEFTMSKINFLFGVGMVENAADETAIIEVVPAEQVLDREPALQAKAKELMPRLQFDEIDVLVVEKIGKNISGSGMVPRSRFGPIVPPRPCPDQSQRRIPTGGRGKVPQSPRPWGRTLSVHPITEPIPCSHNLRPLSGFLALAPCSIC